MLNTLPPDPEAAHGILMEKINDHTRKLDDVRQENIKQNERLDCIDRKVSRIEKSVANIEKNTAGLVDMWQAGEGTVKVLRWFGKCAGWCGGIATAATAIWYAVTNWPHQGG